MAAISEISIQRTASSFSIKRIQDPVKNLNGPFCVIVSGRKLYFKKSSILDGWLDSERASENAFKLMLVFSDFLLEIRYFFHRLSKVKEVQLWKFHSLRPLASTVI